MNVQRFKKNEQGRDYIVGDIHGNFSFLEKELARIRFNEVKDRLFSVGDLVDRGPESEVALDWLAKPWFHAVRGNHEDMAIRWPEGRMDGANYLQNGGAWNLGNPESLQRDIAESLRILPIGIEIETDAGLVGIVHAECAGSDWVAFRELLSGDYPQSAKNRIIQEALWARHRITYGLTDEVLGVRAVVSGHTPVEEVTKLGNVFYIDTGGWLQGRFEWARFTILDAETLEAV